MTAPGSRPRLCLNMIVKDEAAIIRRCLESVASIIDCWCICDTGSSDDTVEIIESFFRRLDKPGVLGRIPFVDFSQARNAALDLCRESELEFEFILLTDADMELVVEEYPLRLDPDAEAYRVRQRTEIVYDNTRLLNRQSEAQYRGPTHEVLRTARYPERYDGVWFIDHACGSSRSEKWVRDKRLLEGALAADPDDARSAYYLGQTLQEMGDHSAALECFERRAAMDGWEEEGWHAEVRAAECRQAMGDAAGFVAACLGAFDRRPHRAEPLYKLSQHYRQHDQYDACLAMASVGIEIPFPDSDLLFIEDFAYRHGFREDISIASFYSKQPRWRGRGQALCFELSLDRDAPATVRNTARRNSQYYLRSAQDLFPSLRLAALSPPASPGFCVMNPSVADADGRIECVVRSVNYQLTPDGQYDVPGPDPTIRTENWLTVVDPETLTPGPWTAIKDLELDVGEVRVLGPEDCRLFRWRDRRWCSATRVLEEPGWPRRMQLLAVGDDGAVRDATTLKAFAQHEKNWMPHVSGDRLFFIYSCDPLVVLEVSPDDLDVHEVSSAEPPLALDHLRGGSQLVAVGDYLVCLVHEASPIPGSDARTYSNRVLLLTPEYEFAGLSDPFHFFKGPIEFVAGLALTPDGGRALVTFGVNDCEAWIGSIDVAELIDSANRRVTPPGS